MKPILPDNYQEKTWEQLQKAVVAIQTSKSIEYSLEDLYQAVENMCSNKMDSQLYTKLTTLTESHVKLNIKTFFADTNDKLVCIKQIHNFGFNIVVSIASSFCPPSISGLFEENG